MTTSEFSNEFDVLLNSQGSLETSIELDEYEKSVLLTEAQETVVRGLYNGTLNGDSLEKTEELRRFLDALIETDTPQEVKGNSVDRNSKFFQLKDDAWFITYESAELSEGSYCKGNNIIQVIPMRQDEWHRSKNNPFKKPNKRKAVRLDAGDRLVEIISEYPISKYLVRYLRRPKPIILSNIEGLRINGLSTITECELNPVLHRIILETAVQLAARRITTASK